MDQALLDFIGKNWLTISLAYGVLKSIAVITPFDEDNRILESLWNGLQSIRGGNTSA
ncbi:hypothetical protein Dalk_4538 [Desulfatibacillum aliphaticivorans]|uniref:Uncharacterized protein n=1 Tax=Desulfatibacillum aliphaticivorans TaxID=218208 RepID=B8FCQ3_DESAL|nr:hypothetical protein [Desulfatibacillum aliphaticivorans]ACL06216.1 hypothetical protein Dalk_4538 [Desulfatibacillum aliphaticivorans]